MLNESTEKSEELGQLSDEAARALVETGAFQVGIPPALGGYEFSPAK